MKATLYMEHDYADRLIPVYTQEIMSIHFGHHVSLSMEMNPVHFLDEDGEERFDYHCWLSEDDRQDARTMYINQSGLLDMFLNYYPMLSTRTGGTCHGEHRRLCQAIPILDSSAVFGSFGVQVQSYLEPHDWCCKPW